MLLNPYRFTSIPLVAGYWIATLGGAVLDTTQAIGSVALDAADNIYVVGATESVGAGGQDVLVAKYSSSGVLQWQRVLGGANGDSGSGISVSSSGDVYVTGFVNSGGTKALLAKYNTSGVLQWQRLLGGGVGVGEYGLGVCVTGGGDVYVTGGSYSIVTNGDLLLAKYNASGVLQWQKTIGGGGTDTGYGIAEDGSGAIYVVGQSGSLGTGNLDVYLTKFNSSGGLLWQRSVGGSPSDSGRQVSVDGAGNVYICGLTSSAGAGGDDLLLAKYNTSGTLLWQQVLGGAGADAAIDLAVTTAGDIYLTGYTQPAGAGSDNIVVAKYNTSGALQWQRTLSGSGSDVGWGIAIDSTGALVIAGSTSSHGAGGTDLLIARLPSDGSMLGTYGPFAYAASSLTATAGALTGTTPALSATARSLSEAAGTLTSAAGGLSTTKIDVV